MDTNPHISLIFVNYRSARYLTKALESLFSCERDHALFEVIVVNNDVAEGPALEELQRICPIVLVENGTNAGFGRGNNIGAQQARGRILGFINPDILWTRSCLRDIESIFDEKKEIGILGMRILDADRREERWSAGKEPNLMNLFRNNLFSSQGDWKTQGLSFPDWVSGGALFIRRDLFSLVGGFDERFFLYFEDVDLCKEVRKRGFSVARHATYFLIHFGGKSRHSAHLQKKHFYASQKKYYDKHRPGWESIALQFFQFFFCRL